MKVTIKSKNCQIPAMMRQETERRFEKLTRYFEHIDEATITHSMERNWHIVDVVLKAGGLLLRSEQKSDDMATSIDAAAEHLERQLRRFKERLHARHRHHTNKGDLPPAATPLEETTRGGDNGDVPEIVKVKRFPIKPMSTEEAALQLELLGHDFFVFSNAESEQVNVIYRRNDGQFGLIEPVLE